jgi:hypothetical protein
MSAARACSSTNEYMTPRLRLNNSSNGMHPSFNRFAVCGPLVSSEDGNDIVL